MPSMVHGIGTVDIKRVLTFEPLEEIQPPEFIQNEIVLMDFQ